MTSLKKEPSLRQFDEHINKAVIPSHISNIFHKNNTKILQSNTSTLQLKHNAH